MYYLFMTRNSQTFCYGSYSKYEDAAAKKQRMLFKFPYAEFEIDDRT